MKAKTPKTLEEAQRQSEISRAKSDIRRWKKRVYVLEENLALCRKRAAWWNNSISQAMGRLALMGEGHPEYRPLKQSVKFYENQSQPLFDQVKVFMIEISDFSKKIKKAIKIAGVEPSYGDVKKPKASPAKKKKKFITAPPKRKPDPGPSQKTIEAEKKRKAELARIEKQRQANLKAKAKRDAEKKKAAVKRAREDIKRHEKQLKGIDKNIDMYVERIQDCKDRMAELKSKAEIRKQGGSVMGSLLRSWDSTRARLRRWEGDLKKWRARRKALVSKINAAMDVAGVEKKVANFRVLKDASFKPRPVEWKKKGGPFRETRDVPGYDRVVAVNKPRDRRLKFFGGKPKDVVIGRLLVKKHRFYGNDLKWEVKILASEYVKLGIK